MKKRVFITIELPDEIKRELLSNEKRWKNLHIRWINFFKMHITLSFLGEVNRNQLELILSATKETVTEIKPFEISLEKICLGPDQVHPTMFWAMVNVDENLQKLKKMIDKNLKLQGFEQEKQDFKPHIVIARARGNQLKGKQTNIPLKNMKFKVENIDVMESQLQPSLEKFKLIEKFDLEG
ncbi:MAG: RNA 2',3'-cyclic phosphodiesterase [Candidatus Pacebacteria bacterium]|nr:RNA 2',3'-cyclic phosphodiesterase [Candidatus Paceibacterota bacterium]